MPRLLDRMSPLSPHQRRPDQIPLSAEPAHMYVKSDVKIHEPKSSTAITKDFRGICEEHSKGPVFIIGSWQTGDFCHIYAAAFRHFTIDPDTPFAVLLVVAQGSRTDGLVSDIEFAIPPLCTKRGRFTLYLSGEVPRDKAVVAITNTMKEEDNAREPFDATFWAEEAVRNMKQGQPLAPVWADLVRKESSPHYKAYSGICMSFFDEYVTKFGKSQGPEKFVCVWGRTSGRPTTSRPLGGANPQYDSSEAGNQQICQWLKREIQGIKAIFIVGDGFNDVTRRLSYVFDLGAFWVKQKSIVGRFQENGFFDFMTAVYDCDVVHVGMKSGGMDTLGVWGQKVVFIDSIHAPEITKSRVGAWSTAHLMPVEIDKMPTSLGKAIENARAEDPKAFKTTLTKKKLESFEKRVKEERLDEEFSDDDLRKIATNVSRMFA
jgi:hypothetical protein